MTRKAFDAVIRAEGERRELGLLVSRARHLASYMGDDPAELRQAIAAALRRLTKLQKALIRAYRLTQPKPKPQRRPLTVRRGFGSGFDPRPEKP